jgi:[ribosomal protein S18]-alanine N-acetyltransferase
MTDQASRIRVRNAIADDAPRLIDLARYAATASQWSPTEYQKLFAPGAVHERVTLVLEEDGVVLGFLVARPLADEWEVENIAVNGPARRRGLGTRLLGEFMKLVENRGGKHVFLEVRESNRAARALYEKWAFVETGKRKSYYHNPEEDALVLKFSFSRQP